MDANCERENCKEQVEYICSCRPELWLCKEHVLGHCDSELHMIKSMYITLNDEEITQISGYISKFIDKINESISISTKFASDLIRQITKTYSKTFQTLNTERQYYINLLSNCKSRKLLRSNYSAFWNALNSIGANNTFKYLDFTDEINLNPSLNCLKSCIEELSSPILNDYTERYMEDYSFRQSTNFLSELSLYQLRLASAVSQKIVEKIKVKNINEIVNPGVVQIEKQLTRGSSTPLIENLQNTHEHFNYSDLSDFFTQDILVKVLKANKAQTFLSKILENTTEIMEIGSVSELITQVEVAGCFANNEILKIFQNKYGLKEHLRIMKQFLLMGQGDMYNSLFRELTDRGVDRDFNYYFHNAISSTCFKLFNPELLRCLTLEYDGELSNCYLSYYIKSPLNTVFTDSMMKELRIIFSFLWKIRSAEFALNYSMSHKLMKKGYLNFDNMDCIHRYCILKFRLTVFVSSLVFFIMNEIIDKEWHQLLIGFDSSLCIEDTLYSVHAAIHSIRVICSGSVFSENILIVINIIQEFIELGNEMNKENHSIYDKLMKRSFLKKLDDISESIGDVILKFKANLRVISLDASHFLKLRLNEFN